MLKTLFVNDEALYLVHLPIADQLAGQRFFKQLARLTDLTTACKNRLREAARLLVGPMWWTPTASTNASSEAVKA